MQTVNFQQHIRTLSRTRRNNRTWQRTADITGFTEERLCTYGVYSPTANTNLHPPLFLFYKLEDGKKIIAKSCYTGPGGNYLSHSLLTDAGIPFSPIQVYEQAPWKTSAAIHEEETQTSPPPEIIPPMSLRLDPDYYSGHYVTTLFTPGAQNQVRQNIFLAAIDAIIHRQKIILIDHKENLLAWAMALLQAFPLEYSFQYISIASFANSNTLLNICDICCFELENAQKAKTYTTRATIIDHTTQTKPSLYATTVLRLILKGSFETSRQKLFAPFAVLKTWSPAQFDRMAAHYNYLKQLPTTSPQHLHDYLTSSPLPGPLLDDIVEALREQHMHNHWPAIWHAIMQNKAGDLQAYSTAATYTVPGKTDTAWTAFEASQLKTWPFQTLTAIRDFFAVTTISLPQRGIAHFQTVMTFAKKDADPIIMRQAAAMIRDFVVPPTKAQKSAIEKLESQLPEKRFDDESLLALIDLPWPYTAWGALFRQLSPADRNQLASAIRRLLDSIRTTPSKLSEKQWRHIVYQYIVFLVTSDELDYFYSMMEQLPLSWEEYTFIGNMMLVLIDKPNPTVHSFENPEPSAAGPVWRRKPG